MTPPKTKVPHRPGKRLLAHDRKLGVRFVAGCDEAGRGSLAGPLVAAAVILDLQRLTGPEAAALGKLDDSKKLSYDVRDRLYRVVMERSRHVSVAAISATTIDRNGLHKSNIAAMRSALGNLESPCERVLVDGFQLQPVMLDCGTEHECTKIIKGDGKSAAIAAAAIVAKVTRDRLMERLDEETDERWAFAEHKGYITPLHSERIQLHGTSHHHRMSYDALAFVGAPVADLPAPGARTLHAVRMARAAAQNASRT
jgi:ribonuclease HII